MNTTVAQLKKEWKLAEIAENGATISKIEIVRKFLRMDYKCVDIASELGVGKSYISKIVKIVKYLDENGVALYDFKKWAYGHYNTVSTLYSAVGAIDRVELKNNDPLVLLDAKINNPRIIEKARGRKHKKVVNVESTEKTSVALDVNGMVDIYLNHKHYRVPMDTLENYLVK